MIPSGGNSKKSESKSIESTNQSECRTQTLKSDPDNLVVEQIPPTSPGISKKPNLQLTIE